MPITDCFESLKGMLAYSRATLTDNRAGVRRLDRVISAATDLLPGHFAKLEPLYDPLTPRFMSAVGSVNSSIVDGSSSPVDFNEYVGFLITELNS